MPEYTQDELEALRRKIQRTTREIGQPKGAHEAHIQAVRLLSQK